MGSEWQQVSIESIATRIAMGPFGSDIKTDNFVSTGVPVIRGGNLTSGRFNPNGFVFLTDAKADSLMNANAFPGDLIFTHRGTLGQVGIVPAWFSPRYVVSQSQMKMTCDITKADPNFVYYFFKSPLGQQALLANTSQTGVPAISRPVTSLKAIHLGLPRLDEQRAIAHILGTLDDKIELNRRMNATLEDMARALFKDWFVDFGPVRAKMDGRAPYLPEEIWQLFPDWLNEEGKPDGWDVTSLGALTETIKGRSYKSAELVESDTALVTLKSFARGGGYRPDGLKSFAGTYKPEQIVTPGELVIACTDVTQAAEIIGRPAIVRGTDGFRRLVASLDTLILRPRNSSVTRAFLYFLGGTEAFVAHTYAHTTGTTVLHLAKDAVPSFTFSRPSAPLVQQFDAVANPVLTLIQSFDEESRTLSQLRDTLLPKLISGEIRVSDARAMVEEALA
ncbi:MAG: restriction endonuclease subunit S [Burkholderiales bacterium]